ncbi:MAG: redox-sensing transcriptional repressor Rex [Kiritimatiellae bacterium]|nr:redox-sensing transcriptional repressor Rex [Kiritimatiellia bacterium]
MKTKEQIPATVVRRLTRYLPYLQRLRDGGVEWVSSQAVAEAFGLTSSTVRQDLSHLDFEGISKRGYRVTGLLDELVELLGADSEWRAVVVGAGNLGTALALHEEFARRGFRICAIFDKDPEKIGQRIGKLTVRALEDLPSTVVREGIQIGIVAVPASGAQQVADLLVASGIEGILNLSLTHIIAPGRVPVVDVRVVTSLLELSHAICRLRRMKKKEAMSPMGKGGQKRKQAKC